MISTSVLGRQKRNHCQMKDGDVANVDREPALRRYPLRHSKRRIQCVPGIDLRNYFQARLHHVAAKQCEYED